MIHISHPFRILFFYELFISLCSIDCYIQFCLLTCYNVTSRSFSNSFNIPFLFFYAHFLVFNLIFISFMIHISHPFRILVFYELFTSLRSIDCYIQFHFLTCCNVTSRSFSNSFNIPFLFFYAHFLVFNLIFISFAYCFSHPFDVYLNNVLFISLCSIVCDIQFHFLTRSIMTSPFYSNSFNFLFFIFFSSFPLCIDLVFFLLFDCFGICFVILLFNWECWYIFCYFIYVVGVLVLVLLFNCFGIGFVIAFPLMDLS